MVAELTVQMTTHDEAITRFLHDGFCKDENLDNAECREVAGHYPGMLVSCAIVLSNFRILS